MHGENFVLFCLQIAVMLACGLALGQLMRAFRQPAVLGEMMGGILLGPTVFGMLSPAAYQGLFVGAPEVAVLRAGTIKLGMLFFLFLVGMEVDLSKIRQHGWSALLVGLIGSLVPLAAGVAMVYLTPGIWGPQEIQSRLAFAVFLGASLANSANPVLARILMDLGLLKSNLGAILMSATVVDDLVGWSMLPLVFSQFHPTGAGGAETSIFGGVLLVSGLLLALAVFGRWIGLPILRWAVQKRDWQVGFIGVVTVMVLASAALAEHLGIHAFLGPFILGVAVAPIAEERGDAHDAIERFVMSFFVPIYFVSMGLTSNFIRHFDLTLVALILAVACVSKIASVFVAARISGLNSRTSLAVGFGMNARGAIGIILASLGRENGVIDERTFVALVVMALVTSLLAGPSMNALLGLRANPTLAPKSSSESLPTL